MAHPWKSPAMLVALLMVVACGGGGGDEADADDADAPGDQAGPVINPDSAATITGTVAFEGTPPSGEPIDMSEESTCAETYDEPPMKVPVMVTDGQIENVFVYVKEGLPQLDWPVPSGSVTIDQQGCRYHPHVLAVQVGQPLTIKNSDGILHNINTQSSTGQSFNISQPVEMETTREFSQPEVMIPVKCDVHGWMEAYIGVTDHPYAVVSDAGGGFTLDNLPPGDYVIEAWHETLGTQTQNVTVGPQESKEISFTFSPSTANRVPLGEPIDLHDHGAAHDAPVSHATVSSTAGR